MEPTASAEIINEFKQTYAVISVQNAKEMHNPTEFMRLITDNGIKIKTFQFLELLVQECKVLSYI